MMKRLNIRNLLLLIIFLVFATRFHMSLTRAFDPDEFAHMHWAWLVKSGELPYRDFFFYNTPLFQFLLAPVFFLPEGAGVVLVVRLVQLLTFAGLTGLVFLTARKTGLTATAALLAALVFAVFPMNFDKSIDIRPDVLMLALYFAAVVLLLSRPWSKNTLIVSGILLSASALIMPKIIFAVPALLYLFLTTKPAPLAPKLAQGIFAGAVTAIIVFLPVILSGSVPDMLRSVLSDSVAVNAGKSPFSPWKALSPWPLVYVSEGGPSFPWRVNTAIWIIAAAGFSAYFLKRPKYGIFYLVYTATGIIFLFAFPAPYLQYFLPLSIVASVTSAYFLINVLPFSVRTLGVPPKETGAAVTIISVAVLLGSYLIQYRVRVSPGWNNTEQLTVLDNVARVIKPEETVYDMVGSYVFRPDAYIFCCHPYAEFIDRLGRPYPTLRQAILDTQTRFVILDRTGMAFWQPKPEDLAFIERHFVESPYRKIYVAGQQFACSDGVCELLNVHGRGTGIFTDTVDIIVPETYEIITAPTGETVTISGQPVQKPVGLKVGVHRFTAPRAVTGFTVRVAR